MMASKDYLPAPKLAVGNVVGGYCTYGDAFPSTVCRHPAAEPEPVLLGLTARVIITRFRGVLRIDAIQA